jgi:diguanylate cyclase (GGDEF)-like protein
MTFDIRPIWMIAGLCSAGFGFLVVLLRRNFSDYLGRALTYWGLAYLCFSALFFLCLGGDALGPFLVSVASRTLGGVGFAFEYWAISALKRQRPSAAWAVVPNVLLFCALIWFTFIRRNVAIGLAASNLAFGAMMVRNALALAWPENDRHLFVDILAAGSFAVLAVSTFFAVGGFVRASQFSASYDFNSPRLIYSSMAMIVVEAILFGLFLLAVSERLNHDFKFQSTHDLVTGLVNRRTFEEIARHEISGAARTGLPLSIFLIDIDRFEQFNVRYGRPIGDFILRSAAETLRGSLRREDYVCRWDGDEFCVLLPRAGRRDAEHIAARTFAAIAEMDLAVGGEPVRVEISVGIVTREDNALEFPLLIQLAEVALHQAREKGKNQFALL